MNYRHAYHAGNFADVLKHAALLAVISHLRKKNTPFAVIDTHAGRGLYDLTSPEARVTKEAKDGIVRLLAAKDLPPLLQDYVDAIHIFGEDSYPGSPLIAAKAVRAQDRIVAVEKHPEEAAALKQALGDYPNARVIAGDGYSQLNSLLPPRERRGVVLIDPPYEADDEFRLAARGLINAHRRFSTGIYLWWYPLKSRAAVDSAIDEMRNAGLKDLLKIELDIGLAAADRHPEERLSATGLMIVNPPYGFREAMEAALPELVARLKRGDGAKADLKDFAED